MIQSDLPHNPDETVHPPASELSDTASIWAKDGLLEAETHETETAFDPNMFGVEHAYLFERTPYPEIGPEYLPPNVHLSTFLSEHATEDDLAPAIKAIGGARIIIPEWSGWTETDLKNWNKLAKGDTGSRNIFMADAGRTIDGTAGYKRALTQTIYAEGLAAYRRGEGKTVVLIDKTKQEMAQLGNVVTPKAGANIDELLTNYGLALAQTAYEAVTRNQTMLVNLGPTVSRVVRDNPKLRNQAAVEVVFIGGLNHAAAFEYLQEHLGTGNKVAVDVHQPEDIAQNPYGTRVKKAFEELRTPSREDIMDVVLDVVLSGYPIEIRRVMHTLMAREEGTPNLIYAIYSRKLTPEVVSAITGYETRARLAIASGRTALLDPQQ